MKNLSDLNDVELKKAIKNTKTFKSIAIGLFFGIIGVSVYRIIEGRDVWNNSTAYIMILIALFILYNSHKKYKQLNTELERRNNINS